MYLNIQELRDFYSVTKVGRKFNSDILGVIGDFLAKKNSKEAVIFGYVNNLSKTESTNVTSCMFSDKTNKNGGYSVGNGIIDKHFIELENKFYDSVIVVNSLEFADSVDSFFSGVFSKMKDDGHALIIAMSYKSLFNKPPFNMCHTFSRRAIEHYLSEHGMEIDDFYYTCYPHFKNRLFDRFLGYFLKFYGAFMVLECHKNCPAKVTEKVKDLKLEYDKV